jgi:hypothetical protein
VALEVSGLDPALALELRLDGGALGVVAVAASVPEAGTLLLLVAAATGLALPRRAGARPKRQADERRPGLHRAGA